MPPPRGNDMRFNSMISGAAAALTLGLILPTAASAGWKHYDRHTA